MADMPSVILVDDAGHETVVSTASQFVNMVYSGGYEPLTGTIPENYAILTSTTVDPEDPGLAHIRLVDLADPDSEAHAALVAAIAEAGLPDHGALPGLADDDHLQYLTQARGDARYPLDTDPRLGEVAGATASATANKMAKRDGSARMAVADGVATGDVVNKGQMDIADTAAKARANHTGTQVSTTISDLTEAVQDIVAAFVTPGTGMSKTYDDTGNTLTLTATGVGGGVDAEAVRDTIAAALIQGTGIVITYNDAGDSITIDTTAVLPTRQVIAGTGLTGGGTLAADRTLAVSFGTTAGTAAQGNDSRLSDARTPLAHAHSVGDLGTTGVRDATTVLHGDDEWRTPAGAGAIMVYNMVKWNSTTSSWPARPAVPAGIPVLWFSARYSAAGPPPGALADDQWYPHASQLTP